MKNLFKIFSKNFSKSEKASASSNKAYGYKELKSIYTKFLGKGMMLSVAFHMIVIGALVYSIRMKPLVPEETLQVRQVVINDINIPEKQVEDIVEQVKEVPKGNVSVPLKNDNALTPEPVKQDNSTVKTTSTQNELNNINVPVSSNGDPDASNNGQVGDPKGTTNTPSEPPVKDPPVKPTAPQNYEGYQVERAPMQTNLNSIKASMKYPSIARDIGTEGKVVVKILVGKDGDVIRVGSISGPEVFYDEVRSKVMGLKFTPAMQNGEVVNCWVTVPFSFTLK